MAKRKADDHPASTVNSEVKESKKRQRLSGDESNELKTKKDKTEKKEKRSKKSKKERSSTTENQDDETLVEPVLLNADDVEVENVEKAEVALEKAAVEPQVTNSKSKKKRRKSQKPDAESEQTAANNDAEVKGDTADFSTQKKHRYIVFAGNLPYSATVADIEKHFSAVHPISIRLLHEKSNPSKSRGVAFVEFAGYDHMKTCLKTLHHSTFTCQGKDYRGRPKIEERKINIELTAGGGGKTSNRTEKIKAKNVKLTEERERRAVEEEKARIKKEKERLTKGGAMKNDADGIHPSRRAQVPKGRR